MFNPKETEADKYIFRIAALVLLGCFVAIFASISKNNALQYIYLEQYGSEEYATVINVYRCDANCKSSGIQKYETEYEFEFLRNDGGKYSKKLILKDNTVRPAYGSLFEVRQRVDMIIEEGDRGIFIPKELHENMVGDRNIFFGGSFLIFIFLLIIGYNILQYKKFQKRMKYY